MCCTVLSIRVDENGFSICSLVDIEMVVPDEILAEEILARLPLKSVLQLRLVSKRWNSLIMNPNFAHSHLTFNSQNPNNDYLILNNRIRISERKIANHPYYYISVISRNDLCETRISKVPFPYSSKDVELIGSINGLVCIACLSKLDCHFVLWNPAISHYNKVFPPKSFRNNFETYLPSSCLFAFGWNSVSNDYKLILKSPYSLHCRVYSTETNSWTKILVPEHFSDLTSYVSRTPCTIVKGCPYWYRDQHSIVKFEIESNDFRYFQFSNVSETYYYLTNLNDCLVRVEYGGAYDVDMYRFDEECKVWSKMYAIDCWRKYWPSLCFKYGGEIVLNNKKCLYDHKSKQIKIIAYDKEGHFVNGFSYTPSLVVVKGMKALHGRGQKRSLPSS